MFQCIISQPNIYQLETTGHLLEYNWTLHEVVQQIETIVEVDKYIVNYKQKLRGEKMLCKTYCKLDNLRAFKCLLKFVLAVNAKLHKLLYKHTKNTIFIKQ